MSICQDDKTRMSLYLRWANGTKDPEAAKQWIMKYEKLASEKLVSPPAALPHQFYNAHGKEWSSEDDKILKDLKANGKSYAHIGKILKRSRNACIGRAKRKGWTFAALSANRGS